MPPSLFFYEVLEYFKIEFIQLNPNSILYLAIFIHISEEYLGMHLDHEPFHHFFLLARMSAPPPLNLLASGSDPG